MFRRRPKRVEVFQAEDGRWYFHVHNRNGRITEPSQGYTRKDSAVTAARRDAPGLPLVILEPEG